MKKNRLINFCFLGDVNYTGSDNKAFFHILETNPEIQQKVAKLKNEVECFAADFPMPGFDNF